MKVVAAKRCTISGLGVFEIGDTIEADKAFAEKLAERGIAKKAVKTSVKKKEETISEDEI